MMSTTTRSLNGGDDLRPTRTRAGKGNSDFTALARQVQEAGLLRRRYGYYWAKLIGLPLAVVATIVAFILIGDTWWQLVTAAVFGVLFAQVAFLGHDAAHRQIFVSGKANDWASLIIGDLFVGMSYGWWRHKHTRHHANPNKEGADPDLELPVIAVSPERVTRVRNPLLRFVMSHQGWLSPGIAIAFLAVELAVFGFYMGGTFAPNHKGMPMIPRDAKLDFLRRQVLTSRNIRGGRLLDVAMGGLNYQVEHHLFPSMPRPHLRKAADIVAAYCAEHDIPYTSVNLFRSYATVVKHINRVGLGDRDPFACPLIEQRRAL